MADDEETQVIHILSPEDNVLCPTRQEAVAVARAMCAHDGSTVVVHESHCTLGTKGECICDPELIEPEELPSS